MGGKFGFGKRRRERGIAQQAIRLHDDESVSFPVKFFPPEFDFPGYVFIFDSMVGIIPFEEPHHGYLISDLEVAKIAKTIFFALWKKL